MLSSMKFKYLILFTCIGMMISCSGEKKEPVFYEAGEEINSYEEEEISSSYEEMADDSNIISVPYREQGGVKFVNVSVNGFVFEMIFDTGCSGTLISVAEANYLYQKGYLTTDDFLGFSKSQIADGSIVENMIVNLKEVIIDGQIYCENVVATVSANNKAPLLLGNEVLNRAAAYAVDNENQVIIFKLK